MNTEFSKQAPELTAFLANVSMPLELMNETMAHMEKTEGEPEDVAHWFLKEHEDTWSKWVPMEVAQRVKAAL